MSTGPPNLLTGADQMRGNSPVLAKVAKYEPREADQEKGISLLDKIRQQNRLKKLKEQQQQQNDVRLKPVKGTHMPQIRGAARAHPQSKFIRVETDQPAQNHENAYANDERDQHPSQLTKVEKQHSTLDSSSLQMFTEKQSSFQYTNGYHQYQTIQHDDDPNYDLHSGKQASSKHERRSQHRSSQEKMPGKEVDYSQISLRMLKDQVGRGDRASKYSNSQYKRELRIPSSQRRTMEQARLSSIDTRFRDQIERIRQKKTLNQSVVDQSSNTASLPNNVDNFDLSTNGKPTISTSPINAPSLDVTPKQLQNQQFARGGINTSDGKFATTTDGFGRAATNQGNFTNDSHFPRTQHKKTRQNPGDRAFETRHSQNRSIEPPMGSVNARRIGTTANTSTVIRTGQSVDFPNSRMKSIQQQQLSSQMRDSDFTTPNRGASSIDQSQHGSVLPSIQGGNAPSMEERRVIKPGRSKKGKLVGALVQQKKVTRNAESVTYQAHADRGHLQDAQQDENRDGRPTTNHGFQHHVVSANRDQTGKVQNQTMPIYHHQALDISKKKSKKDDQSAPQNTKAKNVSEVLKEFKQTGQPNISHKIVSKKEFERLAAEKEADGVPMVEKTIFIVKPIFVHADSLKKKGKKRAKTKKQIYSEKMKAPQYVFDRQSPIIEQNDKPSIRKKRSLSKRKTSMMQHKMNLDQYYLKQGERIIEQDRDYKRDDQSQGEHQASGIYASQVSDEKADKHSLQNSTERNTTGRGPDADLKQQLRSRKLDTNDSQISEIRQIMDSSHIIDEIFHKRSMNIRRQASQEEDPIVANESQDGVSKQNLTHAHSSIIPGGPLPQGLVKDASQNARVRTEIKGQINAPSESQLSPRRHQQTDSRSINITQQKSANSKQFQTSPRQIRPAGKVKLTNQDSQISKFQEKVNQQLIGSGHGIQIVMQESKDDHFFKMKEIELEKLSKKQFDKIRNWKVDNDSFDATMAPPAESLSRRERQKYMQNVSLTNSQADTNAVKTARSGASVLKLGGNVDESRSHSDMRGDGQSESKRDRKNLTKTPGSIESTSFVDGQGSVQEAASAIFTQGSQASVSRSPRENRRLAKKNQLTHERIHALKLLASQNKSVVPIRVQNPHCSHVSPREGASHSQTQIIQANDLNALDKKNPFRFWQDRERRTSKERFNFVPKGFYTNYKSAMMRDAHELARTMVSDTIHAHGAGECTDLRCDCNQLSNNKRLKNKGKKLDLKSKNKSRRVNVNELSNPYKPCRRTCCSSHNPMFHAQRMQQEHMNRLHASATKLMIMSVIPERPKSADSADRLREEYYREIDYTGSTMYSDVLKRKFKKMLKDKAAAMGANFADLLANAQKGGTVDANGNPVAGDAGMQGSDGWTGEFGRKTGSLPGDKSDIDASPERRALGQEDGMVNQDAFGRTPVRFGDGLLDDSSPEPLGRTGGSLAANGSENFAMSGTMGASLFGQTGKSSKFAELSSQPNKKEEEELAENAYSQIEIEYLKSLMKNKAYIEKEINEHHLDEVYQKARKTLKYAMKKLLLKKQFYIIDNQYKLAEDEKQTAENVIKILTRCQKMHEAQSEITKVLVLIHQRLDKMTALNSELISSDKNKAQICKLYSDSVRLSSRIHIAILTLKDNEKALQRPFIFKGKPYDEIMVPEMRKLRLKIIRKLPELKEENELKLFMRTNGDVGDVRKVDKSEWEAKSQDESDSEEESEIEGPDLNRDSLQQLNPNSQLAKTKHAPFSRSMHAD